MKHFHFIFLLLIIGTSRAKGIKIVDPATPGQILLYSNPKDNTLNMVAECMTYQSKINSNEISDRGNYLTINTSLSIRQQGQPRVVKVVSGWDFSRVAKVVSGWDLSALCFLRLNFSQIQQPFDVTVGLKEYGALNYYKDPSGQTRKYNLVPTNLSPVIALTSLINTTAPEGFDFCNVSHLEVRFNTCNADTFRLKSMELIGLDEIPTVMDVVNPVIIDLLQPPAAQTQPTGGGGLAGQTPPPAPIAAISNVNTHFSSNDIELEQEENPAVPEPFSILTMGAGIITFIRKRKS